jgi:hypothetical protein
VLPDQPGPFPHEFIGSGKQGVVYLINRDNMGGYNASSDTGRVIQEVNLGHGNFDSPAFFNGAIYYHAVGDVLKKYTLTNGMLSAAPAAQGTITYSGQGGTPSISANGTANGIVWNVEFSSTHEVLHAYDAGTLTELYNSNQTPARDQLGVGVKFITPTIADGHVFVGSANAVTVYGLVTPPTTPPAAPSNLSATAQGATQVRLTWVDNSDNEAGFKVERSTDNTNFNQIAVTSVNATGYTDSTANPSTTYYYRIRATNVVGDSAYTPTPNPSATTLATTGATDVYHFDEGSGTTAADSAGTNTGTLVGTTKPTWVTGKIGSRALSFSGDGVFRSTTSQSAVQAASDLSTVLGGTASLTAWIKTTQVGGTQLWNSPAIILSMEGGASFAGGSTVAQQGEKSFGDDRCQTLPER